MQKVLLLLLVILLYYPARPFPAYAGTQSPTPVSPALVKPTLVSPAPVSPKPASPAPVKPTPVAKDQAVNYNSQDWEKYFQAQEDVLRKIKVEHVRQERKQHVQVTEKAYQQAVSLYQQQRVTMAKEALGNVEDLMADYKSTGTYLRSIYKRDFEKLKRKMHAIKRIDDPQLVVNLARQAAGLYNQVADLGNDKDTAVIREKLGNLKVFMEKLERQKVAASKQATKQLTIQQQLDRIDQKADAFDQEIFKLTQAKNYSAAKKKYGEFRRAMIDGLAKLKQTMVHEDN
jgi:hypothetical protein